MPYAAFETAPQEVLGPFNVPELGWLVLRAEHLAVGTRSLEVLEGEALGFTHAEIARQLGDTETATEQRATRVHRRLGARSAGHAVRIAREAGVIDIPLDPFSSAPVNRLLSDAQWEALDFASRGYTAKQIASIVGLSSDDAAARRLSRAYEQMGTSSLPPSVTIAYEVNVFTPLTAQELAPYVRYFD